jgi:two-component system, response regulator YesN
VTTHVRRMLDVIERTYADHITLDTLGRALDRQARYLGHLFRKEVGMTVHARVTDVRMDRAVRLIREGVKIEAVALLVGYRGRTNFYRQFRRKYGTTPFVYGR